MMGQNYMNPMMNSQMMMQMGNPMMGASILPQMVNPMMQPGINHMAATHMNQATIMAQQAANLNQQNQGNKPNLGWLKANINIFNSYPQDKKKGILGPLMYQKVEEVCDDKINIPKITGMLIDFDVLEIGEIIEILENKETLKERVKEAKEIIDNGHEN